MAKAIVNQSKVVLERFASAASSFAGSNTVLIFAFLFIAGWAVAGPIMHFSDTWQLIVNTASSVTTFLMVFLIQKAQNKDAMAIQIKLNELISSSKMASNMIVNVEDLSEEELKVLNNYYSKLAEITRKDPAKKSAHDSKIEQANSQQ